MRCDRCDTEAELSDVYIELPDDLYYMAICDECLKEFMKFLGGAELCKCEQKQ